METENIIISLSGGLDSSCLVPYLLAASVKKIKAYSFKWGQKHSVELKKVKKNIQFLQSKGVDITHHIIDLTDASTSLRARSIRVGRLSPRVTMGSGNMKSTVVENRNVIFSSIIYGKALSWSKEVGDVGIVLGIHKNDNENTQIPPPRAVQPVRKPSKSATGVVRM